MVDIKSRQDEAHEQMAPKDITQACYTSSCLTRAQIYHGYLVTYGLNSRILCGIPKGEGAKSPSKKVTTGLLLTESSGPPDWANLFQGLDYQGKMEGIHGKAT